MAQRGVYKPEDLSLNLHVHVKSWAYAQPMPITPALWSRESQILRAHWPAGLTEMLSF